MILKRIIELLFIRPQAVPSSSHGIINTLFRRRSTETVNIQFLSDFNVYDTAKDTIFPQTIAAGKYSLVKTDLAKADNEQSFWYLFKNDTRGLSEKSLNQLIINNQARIIKEDRT